MLRLGKGDFAVECGKYIVHRSRKRNWFFISHRDKLNFKDNSISYKIHISISPHDRDKLALACDIITEVMLEEGIRRWKFADYDTIFPYSNQYAKAAVIFMHYNPEKSVKDWISVVTKGYSRLANAQVTPGGNILSDQRFYKNDYCFYRKRFFPNGFPLKADMAILIANILGTKPYNPFAGINSSQKSIRIDKAIKFIRGNLLVKYSDPENRLKVINVIEALEAAKKYNVLEEDIFKNYSVKQKSRHKERADLGSYLMSVSKTRFNANLLISYATRNIPPFFLDILYNPLTTVEDIISSIRIALIKERYIAASNIVTHIINYFHKPYRWLRQIFSQFGAKIILYDRFKMVLSKVTISKPILARVIADASLEDNRKYLPVILEVFRHRKLFFHDTTKIVIGRDKIDVSNKVASVNTIYDHGKKQENNARCYLLSLFENVRSWFYSEKELTNTPVQNSICRHKT